VPSGLVQKQHRMSAWRYGGGDFLEVQRHALGIAAGQDQGGALALGRTDRAENVGGRGALILRGGWARPAPRPAAGDAVLLADARLVLPPQLYGCAAWERCPDRRQRGGEVFLNAGMAAGSWA